VRIILHHSSRPYRSHDWLLTKTKIKVC
jgi:hypothetical protein